MKISWLGWCLPLLAASTLAAPSDSGSAQQPEKRANRGLDPEDPSVFNGLDVPPLFQLTAANFDEVIKDGTWLVHPRATLPHGGRH